MSLPSPLLSEPPSQSRVFLVGALLLVGGARLTDRATRLLRACQIDQPNGRWVVMQASLPLHSTTGQALGTRGLHRILSPCLEQLRVSWTCRCRGGWTGTHPQFRMAGSPCELRRRRTLRVTAIPGSQNQPGSWPFGWNSPVFTTFTPGNSPAGELFPSQVDEEN